MDAQEAQPRPREIWKVRHQRLGNVIMRLLGDPLDEQSHFEAEILDWRASHRALALRNDEGTAMLLALQGEPMTVRKVFVEYLKRFEIHRNY